MLVSEVVECLGLRVHSGAENLDREISGGYTSDLLSDVMGAAEAGMVWITLQTHINVVAIATLKELAAVILVKGLQPEKNTLEQSRKEGIPILGTERSAFDISGELYHLLQA